MRLMAHDRSNRAAHGGQLSEHFHFAATLGGQFFVSYALPRVPVTPELGVTLFVRSNKQGIRLYAKVMLPADIDPVTKAPSYVLLPGTAFSRVDRWEGLELNEMLPAIEQQARVLRATTRRPVPLDGAYLDRVVVNLMGGVGETEVFLDDLSVAPVSREWLRNGPGPWRPGRFRARTARIERRRRKAAPPSRRSSFPKSSSRS